MSTSHLIKFIVEGLRNGSFPTYGGIHWGIAVSIIKDEYVLLKGFINQDWIEIARNETSKALESDSFTALPQLIIKYAGMEDNRPIFTIDLECYAGKYDCPDYPRSYLPTTISKRNLELLLRKLIKNKCRFYDQQWDDILPTKTK